MYRIRQFIWALFSKYTQEDEIFVKTYLNEYEKKIFDNLKKAEKVHSVRVAKEVLKRSIEQKQYDIRLIKAALLHDIGKIDSGLNIINKSMLVILNKIFPKLLKKFYNINFIRVYYEHPEIAISYIKDTDEYIKFLIKNHHNYNIDDKKLKILQEVDCKY